METTPCFDNRHFEKCRVSHRPVMRQKMKPLSITSLSAGERLVAPTHRRRRRTTPAAVCACVCLTSKSLQGNVRTWLEGIASLMLPIVVDLLYVPLLQPLLSSRVAASGLLPLGL